MIWPLRKSGKFIAGKLGEAEGPENVCAMVVCNEFRP